MLSSCSQTKEERPVDNGNKNESVDTPKHLDNQESTNETITGQDTKNQKVNTNNKKTQKRGTAKTKKQRNIDSKKNSTKDFGWGLLCGILFTVLFYAIRPNYAMKNRKKMNNKSNSNGLDPIPLPSPKDSPKPNPTPTPDPQPRPVPMPDPVPAPIPTPDPKLGPVPMPDPVPTPIPASDTNPVPTPTELPKFKSSFATDESNWAVVGTSVIGNSHISMKLPCQDNCKYESLGDGWGIAVISDGAGSAKRSEIGSKIVVERVVEHLKKLIEKEGWKSKNILPTDAIWMQQAYSVLNNVSKEIASFGKAKGIEYKDMSATVIALIHTPNGLLSVHIGDGRAGYRDMNGGWKSVVTPHKGEEANQTIFITSEFWSHPNYVMSDVFVPECVVIREPISAFTLMSDGCEHTTWLCNQFDEKTQKYYDPNTPYAEFFDGLCETILNFHKDNTPLDERTAKWEKFIVSGNKKFKIESDDKTLVLGVFCEK